MKRVFTYSVFALLFGQNWLCAQNLDKIGADDMLTIHGGINFNTVNYSAFNMENRRDPFTWFASGNLTINVLDVAIPLIYSYSNLGGKFTQPFNQFSLHPTYKKWQSHIGYSSMNFSNYTLAGHLFMGGGLEYRPDHWEFKVMGGRLNKAIGYDAVEDNLNEIAYTRYGGSFLAGYQKNGHELKIIALKAKDQLNSLEFIPINTTVKPKDNVVLSAGGKTKIGNHLTLNGEYALSALTENLISTIETSGNPVFSSILSNNATTALFQAYKASVSSTIKTHQISLNYEHIDPGYTTLGGYFFNNDLENYTVSYAGSFLNGKLNSSLNTGLQLNNLDEKKAATTKRLVGNFNASAQIMKQWMVSANYSNFSNFTRKRPASDPFFVPLGDTLNFYNQSVAAGFQSNINFGKKKLKHVISSVINFSRNTNVTGSFNSVGVYGFGAPLGVSYDVLSLNQNYGLSIAKINLSISTGVNANTVELPDGKSLFIGPNLMVNKNFGKVLSLAGGTVYNRQYLGSSLTSNVFNHKLSVNYKPKFSDTSFGKLTVSFNFTFVQKLPVINSENKTGELNLFTNINYAF